ncbi:MAG: aminopeptidase [Candidatus Nanoarchaeia archaeon]|nr:aminopeptidase [Candidatus Nanoarchaeia archaeon]
MEGADCIDWLKKRGLLDICKENSSKLKTVFKDCLNAKNESILIIGDTGYNRRHLSAALSGTYYFAAKKLGFKPRLFFQVPKIRGDMADKSIVDAIDFLGEKSIIISCVSDRIGSLRGRIKGYRQYCEKKKMKFVTTPSLGYVETNHLNCLINTLSINYPEVQKTHKKVKSILERGTELHIRTNAGTDLHMKIDEKNVHSSDGDYTKYGTGGNLPAGEVYFPPVKKSVQGILVVDGSSRTRNGTELIKNPIKIKIEKGDVVDIQGGKEAQLLRETLSWAERNAQYPWGIRKVCELGIGLNPKAKIIGSTIIDEKSLRTAHVAFGSNNWFGGSIFAMTHLDQVFKNPKITVDGRILSI